MSVPPVSAKEDSAMSKTATTLFAMLLCACASATACAQNAPAPATPAPAAPPSATADHRLIKPGDRTCLRATGSLVPPKPGECLPVAGRSYSGNELRGTGAIDNAHALQMLDPSISLGH
jgi:hypothetical protein